MGYNSTMQNIEFEIDRDAVEQYFRTSWSLLLLGMLGFYFGLGILLAWLFYYKIGHRFCLRWVNALRYRLEGDILRVDSGVLFLQRKSIPLERITDVALVQGLLLRHFGIWRMRIQTAGSAQCEAVLIGVRDPEGVRETILSRRHGKSEVTAQERRTSVSPD